MTQFSTSQNTLGLRTLPHPLPETEPKATCPSRTLAWLLPARPGACHGVMLGQGNASTSPTFTPSLLFQLQEQYAVRADLRPGQGHLLLAAPEVPSPSPTRAQRGAALPLPMPWLTPPEQSGDTAGLQGGTQKIWEHIKGFSKAEPTITMLESSLVPAGIPVAPRADLAAGGSQAAFIPSFRALGSSLSSAAPMLPARLLQGAGVGS